ncbi:MAG: D-aminoacyl-tRNA deacylase [Gammaproteobacteria bacterium]
MIGLLQRVTQASVACVGEEVARIGPGLLVFVGFARGDEVSHADRLIERILGYRVFADLDGRMNRSLRLHGGGLLLVPQFTLVADTTSGARASFTPAAPPEAGERLFEYLCENAARAWPETAHGRFGADMQVSLVNDGPVTFWLEAC